MILQVYKCIYTGKVFSGYVPVLDIYFNSTEIYTQG